MRRVQKHRRKGCRKALKKKKKWEDQDKKAAKLSRQDTTPLSRARHEKRSPQTGGESSTIWVTLKGVKWRNGRNTTGPFRHAKLKKRAPKGGSGWTSWTKGIEPTSAGKVPKTGWVEGELWGRARGRELENSGIRKGKTGGGPGARALT